MKSKRNVLKIICILIMLFTIFSYTLEVNARDDIFQSADKFLDKDKGTILNMNSIKSVSDTLFNMFLAVGAAIVLIVGAVLGIQFMMGSIEEKIKVKEALIPYIIGSIVIFGAIGIWSLVASILEGTFK